MVLLAFLLLSQGLPSGGLPRISECQDFARRKAQNVLSKNFGAADRHNPLRGRKGRFHCKQPANKSPPNCRHRNWATWAWWPGDVGSKRRGWDITLHHTVDLHEVVGARRGVQILAELVPGRTLGGVLVTHSCDEIPSELSYKTKGERHTGRGGDPWGLNVD